MKKKQTKKKINALEQINLWLKKIFKNKVLIVVLLVFLVELFLRSYQIMERNPFGYDQVDNAWAAKSIIVNHKYPLVGMVAKGNSGIYIGPAYYYLVSLFYYIFNLNPVASAILALATSVFTFWTIYLVTRKLFSEGVALIAVVINTFCINGIIFDRIQWPVNFIPGLSLLIFYFLYRVIKGEPKYLIYLAITAGLLFNIHFTAIFVPIIVLLSLPLFPRTKDTLKYILISIPIFIVWIIPNAIYMIVGNTSRSNASYLGQNYHGFHLRRMFQIVGDAFIQFDSYVLLDWVKKIKLVFPVLFFMVYLKREQTKDKIKFLYLIFLWFVVPWVIFTVYSGEISDYYFSFSRLIVLFILSYLIYSIFVQNIATKLAIVFLLGLYCVYNMVNYVSYSDVSLAQRSERVRKEIIGKRKVEYGVGVPESYIYYYLMRKKGVEDVYK